MVFALICSKSSKTVNTSDILEAVRPIVVALTKLSVQYCVAGSVASSAHGVARATLDVDLVADLRGHHVLPLVEVLSEKYYVDIDAVRDAVRRRAMFNAIHLETMLKVDVYLLTSRPFDQKSFARSQPMTLVQGEGEQPFILNTAEDTLLHKLEWYRAGGEVSDRQWGDVIGIIKVQSDKLDYDYLNDWAEQLGVSDLLTRALQDNKE